MEVYYGNRKIKNNEFLTPLEASINPKVIYEGNKYYGLVLIDPDAVHGPRIHWAVINIPGNEIKKGEELFSYNGPAPPVGTGTHRYIFMLFEFDKPIQNIPTLKERNISSLKMNSLLMMYKPKYKIMFLSKNMSGGKFAHNRRKIIIEGNTKDINKIKKIMEEKKSEFNKRNVDVEYINKEKFKGKLIGYDGGLKKEISKPEEIMDFIDVIDDMAMGAIEKLLLLEGGGKKRKRNKIRKTRKRLVKKKQNRKTKNKY